MLYKTLSIQEWSLAMSSALIVFNPSLALAKTGARLTSLLVDVVGVHLPSVALNEAVNNEFPEAQLDVLGLQLEHVLNIRDSALLFGVIVAASGSDRDASVHTAIVVASRARGILGLESNVVKNVGKLGRSRGVVVVGARRSDGGGGHGGDEVILAVAGSSGRLSSEKAVDLLIVCQKHVSDSRKLYTGARAVEGRRTASSPRDCLVRLCCSDTATPIVVLLLAAVTVG